MALHVHLHRNLGTARSVLLNMLFRVRYLWEFFLTLLVDLVSSFSHTSKKYFWYAVYQWLFALPRSWGKSRKRWQTSTFYISNSLFLHLRDSGASSRLQWCWCRPLPSLHFAWDSTKLFEIYRDRIKLGKKLKLLTFCANSTTITGPWSFVCSKSVFSSWKIWYVIFRHRSFIQATPLGVSMQNLKLLFLWWRLLCYLGGLKRVPAFRSSWSFSLLLPHRHCPDCRPQRAVCWPL